MTKSGHSGKPSKMDIFVGGIVLMILFVPIIASGVWLQKQVLGIYSLEKRLDTIEYKLSK